MIGKYWKTLTLILLFILGISTAARASSTVIPADCIINPTHDVLYVVNNNKTNYVYPYTNHNPQIKIYEKNDSAWSEISTQHEALGPGSQCYGMAVSNAGDKLYVGVSKPGNADEIRIYDLEGNSGYPIGSGSYNTMNGDYWFSSSSPANMTIANGRLFVVDQGTTAPRFSVYTLHNNSFLKMVNDQLAGKSNLYGIATGPYKGKGSFISFKIYVSRRTANGEIYVYNYQAVGDTITYEKTISGLQFPSYLKVVDDKLYVSVNGTNGIDILIYDTNDTSDPQLPMDEISSGIYGANGWTAFDVSPDGRWLFFKKALDGNETLNKLYKVDLNDSTDATEVADVDRADGLAFSAGLSLIALTYSPNGNVNGVDGLVPPAKISDFVASDHEDSQSTLTWTNPLDATEVLVVRVTNGSWYSNEPSIDINGNIINGTEVYRNANSPAGQAEEVVDSNLANYTQYFYAVFSRNSTGIWNTTVDAVNGNDGQNADIGVPEAGQDTTPPAAITDLSAAVGDNSGEVKLSWTAVGDDGNTGTANSYIIKYSYMAEITSDTQFDAAETYDQTNNPIIPAAAGNTENVVLTGLQQGDQIWVSIKAQDEAQNISPIGNCAATIVKNNVPSPIISKVYPSVAPNGQVNHITIIGENLYYDMTAAIISYDGTINVALLNVHQDSSTMVQADIPDDTSLIEGTYEISITCPGGTYSDEAHVNPDNDFTFIAPGSDITAPLLTTNFNAMDNQDSQVTLTWDNPSDPDLREILVLRKEGGYPLDHNDAGATQVYQTSIPEPGASASHIDTGLTNGTTYYYALFSRDTSDNWDDTVTEGSNADTGTPDQGTNPQINLIYDANRGNIFWIAVPYSTPYTTASELIADINTQNGFATDSGDLITSIGRWAGASTPQIYETYDYLGILGWSGTDFNLIPGEAIYLNIQANATFILQGSHDPNFIFNLPYDAARGNIFWVSLPYSGNYTDAASIIADINSSAGLAADAGDLITSVGRWDGNSIPQLYETYDYLGPILGWSGTNFNFEPGEGYYININNNVDQWSPAVN